MLFAGWVRFVLFLLPEGEKLEQRRSSAPDPSASMTLRLVQNALRSGSIALAGLIYAGYTGSSKG